MTTVAAAPGLPSPFHFSSPNDSMSTIPDPRNEAISSRPSPSGAATPTQHPDLSNEVATLSNKLINAINYQTHLDDFLGATRHELAASRERVRQLELASQKHNEMVESGQLVPRSEVDQEIAQLATSLAEERKVRFLVERERKSMETELENLTTALFEEANEMVAIARKEKEVVERKNEQLKVQLQDSELLLASHQEQLLELKAVMQLMNTDQDADANTAISTTPPTPIPGNRDSKENLGKLFEALNLSPRSPDFPHIAPSHPTSFTHLIYPVLRSDLPPFEDFTALLRMSQNVLPTTRVPSGSYAGLNVMGLGSLPSQLPSTTLSHFPSNGSTSSLSTSPNTNSTPPTPTTPASSVSSTSSRDLPHSLTPLKETRFYKRALAEDIEPTLRLDLAPGLSWLAKRTVLNAMIDGKLVVEPVPSTSAHVSLSCSLCGESRKGDTYARTHRFMTSDRDTAQRHPLCSYCVTRVRATCDYMGFLRTLKEGHWRTQGTEGENSAWEESVRLREQMFWSRIGGGVIPAFLQTKDSARNSIEEESRREAEPVEPPGVALSHNIDQDTTGNTVPSDPHPQTEHLATPDSQISRGEVAIDREAHSIVGIDEKASIRGANIRESLRSNSSGESVNSRNERLSITIPGAFQ
ncbi:MAG: rab guanine nucleotide exchange factor S2 [Trizodia sp. TS-e1964]|nr:MAG: rab guanine nucleotide exchange factor S2 [Trizodia sp. TS-e1964]